MVLALALFGATGYYDYDGLISLLVPASAFFVLVVAIVNLRRGGDEE